MSESAVLVNDGMVETVPETVSAIPQDAPNHTLRIRFVANDSEAKKAPKYKGYLYLDGVLRGTVIECPIFHDEEKGSYGTALPGGAFKAIKAAPAVIVDKATDQEHLLFGPAGDPIGQGLLRQWNPAIIDAFNRYRLSQTNENPNGCPEQFVTFQP